MADYWIRIKSLLEQMKPYYDHAGIIIYHADWREVPSDLLRAHLLLTDPPYGLNEAAGKNKSRSNLAVAKDYGSADWDEEPPSDFELILLRDLAKWHILWGGNYFMLPPR